MDAVLHLESPLRERVALLVLEGEIRPVGVDDLDDIVIRRVLGVDVRDGRSILEFVRVRLERIEVDDQHRRVGILFVLDVIADVDRLVYLGAAVSAESVVAGDDDF
ncbi:hypothetical protein DVR14_01215 (plasmid) [Natrinema thermotolerans]|nr:hypothetical protein DVR14_01215 [Natrinema thermotolerans]